MITINLRIPNQIKDLYRAANLRMPFLNEPAVIYHAGVKVGRGKVIRADAKTRLYGIELRQEMNDERK